MSLYVSVKAQKVWDVGSQAWVALQQPVLNAGSVTIPGTVEVTGSRLDAIDVNTARLKLTTASGQASSDGNNTCVTPASGKKLRISYLSYNPAQAVECAWRFGAAGSLFIRNAMPAGGIVAKDFGDMRYLESAIDETLVLNLTSAVTTTWNCLYVEV